MRKVWPDINNAVSSYLSVLAAAAARGGSGSGSAREAGREPGSASPASLAPSRLSSSPFCFCSATAMMFATRSLSTCKKI